MFNHSIRKMLAVALVSVPVIWSGATYTAQALDSDGGFQLYNDTDRALTHFKISPSTTSDWGPDILGEGVIIEPGESSYIFFEEGLEECNYDLKATLGPGEDVGSGDLYQTNVNLCDITEYRYGYN